MEYPAIYHGRQISPLALLGRDDREEPDREDREEPGRVTGKGSLVLPGLAPFVIPGLTGNLPAGRVVMGLSDIKMAKNMMDGPVLGCFTAIFGTVRHEIAQKVVGRCLEAMRSDIQNGLAEVGQNGMGVYFRSTRQRPICDSLRWRTL